MKKLFAVMFVFTLTSCGGYETLKTPFDFRGKGINLFGSETKATGQSNTYEVVVNAPAGTPQKTAQDLFDQEAARVCKGAKYTTQITSSGMAQIRDFGVKGVDTSASVSQSGPSLRGYVTCQQ